MKRLPRKSEELGELEVRSKELGVNDIICEASAESIQMATLFAREQGDQDNLEKTADSEELAACERRIRKVNRYSLPAYSYSLRKSPKKENEAKPKRTISAKSITVLAIALALMFALTPIPYVSLFLVPVLFVALTHNPAYGTIAGLMFGLVSLMYAFVMPVSPVAIGFTQAPYIAIVSRIFVGLFSSLAFWGFRRAIKVKGRVSRALPYHLAASVGVITNTALVVSSLVLAAHIQPNFADGLIIPFAGTMFIFFAVELLVANLVVPVLCIQTAKPLKLGEFRPKG